ncbi:MAG: exodeoxyribonuclease VII large subunit [Alphaproteobacteria bacterium]|nr:exodeoxyribonuclease VII large subunit [Alphaproteobacteria bacterium]
MTEIKCFSVSEISSLLKSVVENTFSNIQVRGEITELKRASSGHTYFSLKDKDSVLNAICWRGVSSATKSALQEGLEVICTGHLSTYAGRSNYQMIVESAEPAGEGALLKLLEERKKKLATEGLFDADKKKPIPFLPKNIGVITSPTGAVIRDIMHRIKERFPTPVYLWPVLVQGEGAAEQIASAIRGFDRIPSEGLMTKDGLIPRPDVLIVARGGGSLEDLWCFNEEIVARSAFDCKIPLISAVGHETDTTLIDYVADLRAPTPTGAAEKAVPVASELKLKVMTFEKRMTEGLLRTTADKKRQLEIAVKGMPKLSELVENYLQRLDDKTERLNLALTHFMSRKQEKFSSLSRLLEASSYERVLDKGFALITDGKKGLVSSAQKAQTMSALTLKFKDGEVKTKVLPRPMTQQELF